MADEEKLKKFGDPEAPVTFYETVLVKEGVECDVYSFDGDGSRDLAVVRVAPGVSTPLQEVVDGITTTEGYISGRGTLTVGPRRGLGEVFRGEVFSFDEENPGEVLVEVGQVMQWTADPQEGLVFYEVCVPPYQDGRFENLSK